MTVIYFIYVLYNILCCIDIFVVNLEPNKRNITARNTYKRRKHSNLEQLYPTNKIKYSHESFNV